MISFQTYTRTVDGCITLALTVDVIILSTCCRTRGLLGLYKGLETKLTQTVLMAALMFLTYEKIAAVVFKLMRAQMPVKQAA